MRLNQLPSKWETEHLVIMDSEKSELPELQAVFDNCAYIGDWTGMEAEDEGNYMEGELEHKHVPEGRSAEYHKVQSIRSKEDGKMVGYFIFYHGYPDDKTLWLSVMAVHTEYQGKRLGQEAIDGLTGEAKKLGGYERLALTVGIKNWPAIRFWVNNGFTEIIKINGDKIHSEKTFADIWLAKKF
jgi:diamine N-acetyltransferase